MSGMAQWKRKKREEKSSRMLNGENRRKRRRKTHSVSEENCSPFLGENSLRFSCLRFAELTKTSSWFSSEKD